MATKKLKSRSKNQKTVKAVVSKRPAKDQKSAIVALKRWNIVIAIVLIVQALAVFILGRASTLPVVSRYLAKDSLAGEAAGQSVWAPAVRHLFYIDIRYLLIAVLLTSAIIHWLAASIRRRSYEEGLNKRVNTLRWIDYGISSGLMFALIAMLNGVYDVATLAAILTLVGLLHYLAFYGESKAADTKLRLQLFAVICVIGAVIWLAIGSYMTAAWLYGDGLNHLVYWINGLILAVTLGLAYNKLQTFRQQGRWADYIFGERIFMTLSFVAKTALVWLVFAGFLK